MTRSAIVHFNADRPRCMEKVILKPGDTVQHTTLGEGTVTVADEEFCTVRFETREAMFRLPDAFEEGFLSSEDAEIIEDDEDIEDEEVEEEEEEEEEPNGTVQAHATSSGQTKESPAKKNDTSSKVIIAIGLGIFFIPIGCFLFSIGIKSFDDLLGELSTVIGIVFILGPLIVFIPGLDKVSTHHTGSGYGSFDMDSSIEAAGRKNSWLSSNDDEIRRQIYAQEDEDLSILEDMIQMRSANPDADLQEHYGWEHKIDYDQDGGDDV